MNQHKIRKSKMEDSPIRRSGSGSFRKQVLKKKATRADRDRHDSGSFSPEPKEDCSKFDNQQKSSSNSKKQESQQEEKFDEDRENVILRN